MPRPARNLGAKEMHVIRHDDIPADKPAVAFLRRLPFMPQYVQSGRRGQNGTTAAGAGGDEVDGMGQANPPQTVQMNSIRHGTDCGSTRGGSKTKSATSSPWPTENDPPCRLARRGGRFSDPPRHRRGLQKNLHPCRPPRRGGRFSDPPRHRRGLQKTIRPVGHRAPFRYLNTNTLTGLPGRSSDSSTVAVSFMPVLGASTSTRPDARSPFSNCTMPNCRNFFV